MQARPLYCFIDDAEFELANFRDHAAAAFAPGEFIYAQSFEQARGLIADRPVLAFLLDIYGADPNAPDPQLPTGQDLAQALGPPFDLASLHQGLGDDPDPHNAFLRRLYGQVELWQGAFLLAADALGQGRAYGLANLAAARREYPWAAALGYSRKALYADAQAMSLAGADGVLQKPQGVDEGAIASASEQGGPELARAMGRAVNRRLLAVAGPMAAGLQAGQGTAELVEAFDQAAGFLDPDEPTVGRGASRAGVMALKHEDMAGLSPVERSTVEALRTWLATG